MAPRDPRSVLTRGTPAACFAPVQCVSAAAMLALCSSVIPKADGEVLNACIGVSAKGSDEALKRAEVDGSGCSIFSGVWNEGPALLLTRGSPHGGGLPIESLGSHAASPLLAGSEEGKADQGNAHGMSWRGDESHNDSWERVRVPLRYTLLVRRDAERNPLHAVTFRVRVDMNSSQTATGVGPAHLTSIVDAPEVRRVFAVIRSLLLPAENFDGNYSGRAAWGVKRYTPPLALESINQRRFAKFFDAWLGGSLKVQASSPPIVDEFHLRCWELRHGTLPLVYILPVLDPTSWIRQHMLQYQLRHASDDWLHSIDLTLGTSLESRKILPNMLKSRRF